MEARRWDAAKMAEKFGVHVSTVYRWCNGQLPPRGMSKFMLEKEFERIEKRRAKSNPSQAIA